MPPTNDEKTDTKPSTTARGEGNSELDDDYPPAQNPSTLEQQTMFLAQIALAAKSDNGIGESQRVEGVVESTEPTTGTKTRQEPRRNNKAGQPTDDENENESTRQHDGESENPTTGSAFVDGLVCCLFYLFVFFLTLIYTVVRPFFPLLRWFLRLFKRLFVLLCIVFGAFAFLLRHSYVLLHVVPLLLDLRRASHREEEKEKKDAGSKNPNTQMMDLCECMIKVKGDVVKYNKFVEQNIHALATARAKIGSSMEDDTTALLHDVVKGYKLCPNKEFVEYIERQEEALEGTVATFNKFVQQNFDADGSMDDYTTLASREVFLTHFMKLAESKYLVLSKSDNRERREMKQSEGQDEKEGTTRTSLHRQQYHLKIEMTPALMPSETDIETWIAAPLPKAPGALQSLLRDARPMEVNLLKWLAGLTQREVTRDYKPNVTELACIRRILRFYYKLVPIMRQVYKENFKGRNRVSVFVSHTGADKDLYAAPLANYLSSNHVENVFLDRRMRLGAKGDDEMMWSAVDCKYMWCVLTKDFVQNWYPLRELMVGYVRHILETPKDFTLILDCMEHDYHRGQWMDTIIDDIQSLKLYTEQGQEHSFPASMQRAWKGESSNQRIARIASAPLASGKILVPKPSLRRPWSVLFYSSPAAPTYRNSTWLFEEESGLDILPVGYLAGGCPDVAGGTTTSTVLLKSTKPEVSGELRAHAVLVAASSLKSVEEADQLPVEGRGTKACCILTNDDTTIPTEVIFNLIGEYKSVFFVSRSGAVGMPTSLYWQYKWRFRLLMLLVPFIGAIAVTKLAVSPSDTLFDPSNLVALIVIGGICILFLGSPPSKSLAAAQAKAASGYLSKTTKCLNLSLCGFFAFVIFCLFKTRSFALYAITTYTLFAPICLKADLMVGREGKKVYGSMLWYYPASKALTETPIGHVGLYLMARVALDALGFNRERKAQDFWGAFTKISLGVILIYLLVDMFRFSMSWSRPDIIVSGRLARILDFTSIAAAWWEVSDALFYTGQLFLTFSHCSRTRVVSRCVPSVQNSLEVRLEKAHAEVPQPAQQQRTDEIHWLRG